MLHQTLIHGMCYVENAKLLTVTVSCLNLPKPRTFVVTATIRQPRPKHVNLGLGDVKARDKGDKASLELPEENTNEKATDINNTTLIKQSDSAVDLDKHEESSTFSSSPQPGPSSRLDKDDELDIDKPFADVSSASVVAADDPPDDGDGQSKKTDSPVSSSSTKEMTSVLKYSKEVMEREKKPWEKAQFGWIEKPQRASGIFYNKILPSFYESYWPANPNEKSFKAAFYLERKREWEDSNELEAHKRSFRYLCSDNNAAAGNFLEATYVPKKNDLYSIQTVHKSIVGVKENVNELLEKIKLFDDSLFKKAEDGKEKLKAGRKHHRKFNEDMFKEISNFFKQIDDILKKLQQAESLCKETFKCSHAVASRSEKMKVIDNKYKAKKRKEEALRGKAKTLFERLGVSWLPMNILSQSLVPCSWKC